MANIDTSVGELPQASIFDKESLLLVENQGIAERVSGAQIKEFLRAGNGGGSGLSIAEKTIILLLFKNAVYAANMSATIARLETLWSGGEVPDEPDVPDLPGADVSQNGNVLSVVSGVSATLAGRTLIIV